MSGEAQAKPAEAAPAKKVGSVAACPSAGVVVVVKREKPFDDEADLEAKLSFVRTTKPGGMKHAVKVAVKAGEQGEAPYGNLQPGNYDVTVDGGPYEITPTKTIQATVDVPMGARQRLVFTLTIPRKAILRLSLFRFLGRRCEAADVEFVDANGEKVDEAKNHAFGDGTLEVLVRADFLPKIKAAKVYFLLPDGTRSKQDAMWIQIADAAPVDASPANVASRILKQLGLLPFETPPIKEGVTLGSGAEGELAAWELNRAWARFCRECDLPLKPFDAEAAKLLARHYYTYTGGASELPILDDEVAVSKRVNLVRLELHRGEGMSRSGTCNASLWAKDGSLVDEVLGIRYEAGNLWIPCRSDRTKDVVEARVELVPDGGGRPKGGFLVHVEKPADVGVIPLASRALYNLGFLRDPPLAPKGAYPKPENEWEHQVATAALSRIVGLTPLPLDANTAAELEQAYLDYDPKPHRLPDLEVEVAGPSDKTVLLKIGHVRAGALQAGIYEIEIFGSDGRLVHEESGLRPANGVLAISVDRANVASCKLARLYRVEKGRRVDGRLVAIEDFTRLSVHAKATRALRALGIRQGPAVNADLTKADELWQLAVEVAIAQRLLGLPVVPLDAGVATALDEGAAALTIRNWTLQDIST